jgi:hypothetical protein
MSERKLRGGVNLKGGFEGRKSKTNGRKNKDWS